MKLLVQILTAILILANLNAQAQDDKLLSVKKMQKDFDNLLLSIEAHPDPFIHFGEKAFMAKFDEEKKSIEKPMTSLEFYKKMATMIALLKDGHSVMYLPKGWMNKKRKKNGVFPFEVHLTIDDELYLIKNYGTVNVPLPAKIISVNGIPVSEFLNKIDPYISYELKQFRNTIIDDQFEKYLYLAFGFSNNLELEYLHSDTTQLTVKNIPIVEWKQEIKDEREDKEKKIARGEPYDYRKIQDGIAMISVYSFAIPVDRLNDYDVFLQKTFKKIAQDSIHSLIIDVRGNYGGWPIVSSKLFHYLTDLPFKTMAKSSLKVSHAYREYYYKQIPELRHNTVLINKRRHYIDLDAVLRGEIGTYVNEDSYFKEITDKKKFEFKGDCYLLINRDSYSAASSFAATFQCYQVGALIGEETGGTKIFRANAFPTLLGSSAWISMSTTKKYSTCYSQEFEGVTPTVEYSPSIFELVSDLDTQLIFTQRLIKQVQKKKAELETSSGQ